MVNRSVSDENWVCGHALMATVPPRQHCEEHGMDVEYPHQMPDLPKPDLARMLNLCAEIPELGDELTPIKAWAMILAHPDAMHLTAWDFQAIRNDLKPRCVCHGYVLSFNVQS